MRLSDFIHDTLYEIALGVQLGRARSRDFAAIAPESVSGEKVAEKTYVDFDVAVVVGETDTKTKGGGGHLGAEIRVASVVKANAGADGKLEASATASTQQTHRVAFKVPIYLNAHFRDNPLATADAKQLLAVHGIAETPSQSIDT